MTGAKKTDPEWSEGIRVSQPLELTAKRLTQPRPKTWKTLFRCLASTTRLTYHPIELLLENRFAGVGELNRLSGAQDPADLSPSTLLS